MDEHDAHALACTYKHVRPAVAPMKRKNTSCCNAPPFVTVRQSTLGELELIIGHANFQDWSSLPEARKLHTLLNDHSLGKLNAYDVDKLMRHRVDHLNTTITPQSNNYHWHRVLVRGPM
jgi:hypothetical protein